MIDLEHQPGVSPTENSAISVTGRKILLATPSQEEIAAQVGIMVGARVRPQANQQLLSQLPQQQWVQLPAQELV
jgi:hypothetical protein